MSDTGSVIMFPSRTSPEEHAAKNAAQVEGIFGAPVPFFNMSGNVSALDQLPFVTWAPENRTNYWNDEPTADDCEDYQRGKRFASDLLAAVRSDATKYGTAPVVWKLTARRIELILESIIRDGIRRHKKGGPGSRTVLTSAMEGFLCTFMEAAVKSLIR